MKINKLSVILNEKLGVSEDGEILADFLIKFLSTAEPGKVYIFLNPDFPLPWGEKLDKRIVVVHEMPKLQKKIFKIVVNYSTEDVILSTDDEQTKEKKRKNGTQASFNPLFSKYTKDGYVMYFTFNCKEHRTKIWRHHIYHEVMHGIQYLKMGKKKMIMNRKNIKKNMLESMDKYRDNPAFSQFLDCLYHSIQIEQGALIAQFYGKLKYRKGIKSLEDLRKIFDKRSIHEYKIAYTLAYINIEKLFQLKIKYIKTGEIKPVATQEEMKIFFSTFKKIGKLLTKAEVIEDLTKIPRTPVENSLMSDKELSATIKNYTKYFNKIGKDLIKKLDKTYPKLEEYYLDKFEKEKKEAKKPINKIIKFTDKLLGINKDLMDRAEEIIDREEE